MDCLSTCGQQVPSVVRPKFTHFCVVPSGLPLGRTLKQGYASTLTLDSRMPPLWGRISRHQSDALH